MMQTSFKATAAVTVLSLGWALGCGGPPAAATHSPQAPASAPPQAEPATEPAKTTALPRRIWQDAVAKEADRLQAQYPDATIRLLALEVATGAVLASSGPVDEPHRVGSTIKPLTIAAAIENGLAPDAQLDCTGPAKVGDLDVTDHEPHHGLSVAEGLAASSNVCIVRIAERTDWARAHALLSRLLVLPERELGPQAAAVTDMIGFEVQASTEDLARAYATVAGGGKHPVTGERIVSETTSTHVRSMLELAVSSPDATGSNAAIPGRSIAGKTGTAAAPRTALFVGIVPATAGDWVLAVVVENGPSDAYGGSAAAPAFKRVAMDVSHAKHELAAP